MLSWWALSLYAALLVAFVAMTVAWYRRKSYNRIMTEKINTFVNFAHDPKTPITLIKTPLNDLESMDDLSDKVRSSVMTANRNSDRLMSMINNLLDIRKNDRDWSVLRLAEYDSGIIWTPFWLISVMPPARKGLISRTASSRD